MQKELFKYVQISILILQFTSGCNLSWEREQDARSDVVRESLCPEGVLPAKEECNGKDDDCDGQVDEDFECVRFTQVSCRTSCNTEGKAICTADCHLPPADYCQPLPELCNGVDDDCDTIADNGYECIKGSITPCSTSCGEGNKICLEDTCRWGICEGAGECNAGQQQDCTPILPCGHGMRSCDSNCYWGGCTQEVRDEVCDSIYFGHDNDCDGLVDEGKRIKLVNDLRITSTSEPSDMPDIVWTGSEFFVVWLEGIKESEPSQSKRKVFGIFLSDDGSISGDAIEITRSDWDHNYPLAVVGDSEIGVFWLDFRQRNGYDIFMARLNFLGDIIGNDIVISDSTGTIFTYGFAWSGRVYGVGWSDNRNDTDASDIFFQTFNSSGSQNSAPVNITNSTGLIENYPVKPVWTGSEFILVYTVLENPDTGHCKIVWLSHGGGLNKGPDDIVSDNTLICIPTWINSEYAGFAGFALAWVTFEGIKLGLFEPQEGRIVAGPITIYNSPVPGSEMVPFPSYNSERNGSISITWTADNGSGRECWLAETSVKPDEFTVVSGPLQVSESQNTAGLVCNSAWTGSSYGIVWSDNRDNPDASEIYFTLFGCP